MGQTVYWDGGLDRWYTSRAIHVWKFCKKARVKGLDKATCEPDRIKRVEVKVNGNLLSKNEFEIKNNRIHFRDALLPNTYREEKSWLFGLIKRIIFGSEPAEFYLEVKVLYNYVRGYCSPY